MKKLPFLFLFQLLLTSFVFGINPSNKKNLLSKEEVEFKALEKNALESLSQENFVKWNSRKPNLIEKVGLKLMRKSLKRKLKRLKKKINKYSSDKCDLLVFKNGDELEIKIEEINETSIKYRKCVNLDGPIYSTEKSKIFMIKYGNGTKEMITSAEEEEEEVALSEADKPHLDSWLLGLFAGLLLGIFGLLFVFAFPKGPKRKGFKGGWGSGFLLLIILYFALLSVE